MASKMEQSDKQGPGVKFPPPLVFVLFMASFYLIHFQFPLHYTEHSAARYLGVGIIIGSLFLLLSLVRSFSKAKTKVEPWKPTKHLITTGIYRYSRNPIYLGFCLVTLGISLVLDSVWLLLAIPMSLWVVFHIAVKKEETYLLAKFGHEYQEYKNNVRRWL